MNDAAVSLNVDALRFLLSHGADAGPDKFGQTGIHLAAWQYGHPDDDTEATITLLADHGIAIDARDHEGQAAMHHAVEGDGRNEGAVRCLLHLGAEPDPLDDAGVSPLLLACWAELPEPAIVRLLVAAGADPRRPARDGVSPLDAAAGDPELRAALLSG